MQRMTKAGMAAAIGLMVLAGTARAGGGSEISCNAGPLSLTSKGSVGISAAGVGVSVNPRTREVCAGVTSQAGAGAYVKGSAMVCVRPKTAPYVKTSGGVGSGVGADSASAGCAVVGHVTKPLQPILVNPLMFRLAR